MKEKSNREAKRSSSVEKLILLLVRTSTNDVVR